MIGKLVVIEGIDGSGKGTQFKLLLSRLRKEGVDFETVDFPQYDKPSSYFVREYLNGNYGSADEVSPRVASIFYALDRYDEAPTIRKWLSDGKLVLSNRYTTSNLGHQGAKATDGEERVKMIKYIEDLEYEQLGIPKPDKVILLSVHPFVAQQLVERKEDREYLKGKRRDIHEADINHLRKATESYRFLAERDSSWTSIDCMKLGVEEKTLLDPTTSSLEKVKTIEEIHALVWNEIAQLLDN